MTVVVSAIDLRSRFESYCAQERERNEFIDNALKTIEDYENEIRHLKQEIDHEKNSRVTFQHKVEGLNRQKNDLESSIAQNAFVVVLVDGDGAIFRDELLQKPKEGAYEASRRIIQEVQESLRDSALDARDLTVVVRIFANLHDLAKTLHLTNTIASRGDFSVFAESFTTSRGEFDFVNVGPGKENADSKMRKMLDHFHRTVQCKKIFFVGCHDNGYLNDLQQYTGPSNTDDHRIVLVETTPAQPSFRSLLPFPVVQFNSVFRSTSLHLGDSSPSPKVATCSPARELSIEDTSSVIPPTARPELRKASPPSIMAQPAIPTTSTAGPGPTMIISGNGGRSVRYGLTYATAGGSEHHQNISLKPDPTKETRARTIEYNRYEQRLDPPNKRPSDQAAWESYHAKLSDLQEGPLRRGFCNYKYLNGSCRREASCRMEHEMVLTEAELAVHRFKARFGPCSNGPSCSEWDCFFSHHCPYENCTFSPCKFDVHLSGGDRDVWERWTEGKNAPDILRQA